MRPGTASTPSFTCQICSPAHFCASASWRRRSSVAARAAATAFGGGCCCAWATPASRNTRAASRSVPLRFMSRPLLCGTRRDRQASGREALEHARKGNGLAHVLQSAEPRHAALDAHAEAGVRDGAEAAEVEVPGERVAGQRVLRDARLERRQVVLALPAAD